MIITWHGLFTLKIASKETTILIDPYAPDQAASPIKSKADIVALTNPNNPELSYTRSVPGDPHIINTPGEYAISDATLYAQPWRNQDGVECSLHRWHIEDTVLVHLGALNRTLTDKELQELEKTNIDILFLPIGGHGTLDTQQALELLNVIEPNMVIPINFASNKSKANRDTVETFAKEMGVNPKETAAKLNITGRKIDRENLTTVILEP